MVSKCSAPAINYTTCYRANGYVLPKRTRQILQKFHGKMHGNAKL